MLVGFLKCEEDVLAECQVVAYTDRIFVRPSLLVAASDLEVLRIVCVEVKSASPAPLRRIEMLCPVGFEDLRDVSGLLLKNSTLAQAVTSFSVYDASARSVDWDGVGLARIPAALQFEHVSIGTAAKHIVTFDQIVKPGERVLFALRMTCRRRTTSLSFFRRQLEVRYFLGHQVPSHLNGMVTATNEIPCLSFYAGNPRGARVSGGFDVAICHPQHLKASPSHASIVGTIRIDADGASQKKPSTLHLWRLRSLVDSQVVSCKLHRLRLMLDLEIPHIWLMFVLSVVVSTVLATFVVPLLKQLFGVAR